MPRPLGVVLSFVLLLPVFLSLDLTRSTHVRGGSKPSEAISASHRGFSPVFSVHASSAFFERPAAGFTVHSLSFAHGGRLFCSFVRNSCWVVSVSPIPSRKEWGRPAVNQKALAPAPPGVLQGSAPPLLPLRLPPPLPRLPPLRL